MLTGTDIRQARQIAGMSQADLARAVGVSMRSIGNYERGETVPRNKLPIIERVLNEYIDTNSDGPSLTSASDGELLAEIARRFERGHHVPPKTQAGSPEDVPATPQVSEDEDQTVRVVAAPRSPQPDDPGPSPPEPS